MADPARRRPENVPGPWFVDATCIDCGTCMWMASQVFEARGDQAAVHRQPDQKSRRDAAKAMVSCPTGSIGGPVSLVEALSAFPDPVAPDAWHLGFHDRRSFGAASYLARTRTGWVMVDVPRFVQPLAARIQAMGDVQWIVFTHRDDVAGHQRWHDALGAPRAIHAQDAAFEAETLLDGESGEVGGLEWIHVPGHTAGSVVYRLGTTLFTGDHLAGGLTGGLRAFRDACWHDWDLQRRSMARLADLEVEHVLPGHGAAWHGTTDQYSHAVGALLDWMERVR